MTRARDDDTPIPILWTDALFVVVAKPAGCLVVGAPGRSGPTLIDRLTRQLGERMVAVHRLDEDTTGTLVVARGVEARKEIEPIFRAHAAERVYLALVARVPSPSAGRIESKLAVGDDGVVRSTGAKQGERAVTVYRTIARRDEGALLECRLETGRRNQIRAHLAELGAPIVGDRKYGWRARASGLRPSRPMLHAWRIAFDHPRTGARITVEAPPVEDELRPPA
ncbi:MAG: RluA family pseudouridine synthase [Planctomycetota bacterium]